MRKTAFMQRQTRFTSIRAIEDWCIQRMRKAVGKDADDMNNSEVTDWFLRDFKCTNPYLKDFYKSADRRIANDLIYFHPDDDENVQRMRNSLAESLDNEEAAKYKRLLDFGRGREAIHYRGWRATSIVSVERYKVCCYLHWLQRWIEIFPKSIVLLKRCSLFALVLRED